MRAPQQTSSLSKEESQSDRRTWDRKKFSSSINKVLEIFQERRKADFIKLMWVLYDFHREYGSGISAIDRRQEELTDNVFKDFLSFIENIRSSLTLTVYRSDEWAEEVLSILTLQSDGQVVDGRMFLVAGLLSQFSIDGKAAREIPELRQRCITFIGQLNDELIKLEKTDITSLFTEKGYRLYKALFPSGPGESNLTAEDSLIGTANLSDCPTDRDSLSRDALARYLAKRLRHVYNTDIVNGNNGSFFAHIDGAWGSGKSTLLRFLQKHLQQESPSVSMTGSAVPKSERRWIIVNFNAWENQRLDPPWWFLMKSVYREARKKLWRINPLRSVWLTICEWLWRLNTGTNYLVAALLTLFLLWWLTKAMPAPINPAEDISLKDLPYGPLLAFIGFLWSLTKFLRTSLVPGSAKAAQSFMEEHGKDPMKILANHFSKQILRIGSPVAVFIDDLDRCNNEYAVNLLEGLQTIFRRAPVVYVVAADRKWLYTVYEHQYSMYAEAIAQPAKPFGLIFLDKIFQLIVEIPDISAAQKMTYWNSLLNVSAGDQAGVTEDEKKEIRLQMQGSRTNAEKLRVAATGSKGKQQFAREQAVGSLSIQEEEKAVEHRLQKFVGLVEPNPRSMKRLINDIGTAKAIAFLYNRDIGEDQLILWTILKLRYPDIAEFFWKHPRKIDEVGPYAGTTKLTAVEKLDALLALPEVKQLFSYTGEGIWAALNSDFVEKMKFQK